MIMSSQTLPEEILQRIRDKVAEGRTRKVPSAFRPPVHEDFAEYASILCFDQTLSNCGWALLSTERDAIRVGASGTIRPTPTGGAKGFEATFAKAVILSREIIAVIHQWYGLWDEVVLELPSVVGYRTESSLVAAVVICVELDRMGCGLPEFVSRQAAGALLCGDRHAPKAVSSELVNRLVTEHAKGAGEWTEHVRDAVFVGLKHLYLEEK